MEASSAAWWRRASSRKSEIMALAAWFGISDPCGSTAPVLGSVSCVVVGRGGAQVAGGSPVASLDQNEPFVRRIRMGTRRRTPMNQQERVLFQLTRRLQAVTNQGARFHGNFGTVRDIKALARRFKLRQIALYTGRLKRASPVKPPPFCYKPCPI